MSKALCPGILLLLMTACTAFDPSGVPTPPPSSDASADGNAQVDARESDAMVDANLSDAPTPDAPLPPCATDPLYVANPATGRKYRYDNTIVPWTNARDICDDEGAHLVVINDADEDAYVYSIGSSAVWIGLHDLDNEATFVWVTGAPATYTNWENGEPNNGFPGEDCVELRTDGKWNDDSCDAIRRFVCECDPDLYP